MEKFISRLSPHFSSIIYLSQNFSNSYVFIFHINYFGKFNLKIIILIVSENLDFDVTFFSGLWTSKDDKRIVVIGKKLILTELKEGGWE